MKPSAGAVLLVPLLALYAVVFAASVSSVNTTRASGPERATLATAAREPVTSLVGERVPERGIQENEAAVVDVCASYVDAQFIYFGSNKKGGPRVFAQKIRSTPGRHDGLYWELGSGEEDESPVGPFLAAAAIMEEPAGRSRPFFGYYYRILLSQGAEARGRARDYRVNGRMVAGFALLAWPADYEVSGVRSFLVDQRGVVYAKDLGQDTARAAREILAFSPDGTWTKVVADTEKDQR